MPDSARHRAMGKIFVAGAALLIGGGFLQDFGLREGGSYMTLVGGILLIALLLGASSEDSDE
jgi:hypothetical protein